MDDHRGIATILELARGLIERGEVGSAVVRGSGRVERPVPVVRPDGALHSWFVPVTVRDRLAAFLEFRPDATLMRYSTFQRREDSLDGCPAAASWIDATAIRERAEREARPGEIVAEPRLTYDRSPSRLAWAVDLTSTDGGARTLYIAGDVAWEAAPDDDSHGSIDGAPPR